MLNLLQRLRPKRSRGGGQPELVSLHIPKTAGTSFRKILKETYGDEDVIRLDIPLGSKRAKINTELYGGETLPAGTRVVHGHFRLADLNDRFPGTKDLPVVTWVRDPVERVISNYFYLQKILKQLLDEEGRGVNILSKMQRSLLEYASAEINRNRQSKFLAGRELEDFAFVGIQEEYPTELVALSQVMGWVGVEEIKVNVTGARRPEVSTEVRDEIARLNAADQALYQRALHLRQRRIQRTPIRLISIHIPKTAGTSFHAALKSAYGDDVSPSYRRRDVEEMKAKSGSLLAGLPNGITVLHGHFRYAEVKSIHEEDKAGVIAWLREPVDRVISNYRFFIEGLKSGNRNAEQFEANKHRVNETLLTYAERPENRNVMSRFLEGIEVDQLTFIGFQEHFAQDLARLQKLYGDVNFSLENENASETTSWLPAFDDPALRARIAALNQLDAALYARAKTLRAGE